MSEAKIHISLQAFNYEILNQSCKKLLETLKDPEISEDVKVKGPIFLPTHRRIYCVLRSPHVNKDSREQFEIRRYKRFLEIYTSSVQASDKILKSTFFPAGIDVNIKINKLD
jgi:small subunit ribosomal protein S10